jgi:hypothetical protein
LNNSIKAELTAHILCLINDAVLTTDHQDEWHFHAFNESPYLIGYYNCEEWLKKHDVSAFEAIDEVVQYEQDNFGEAHTSMNSEAVVNMFVYIKGEEVLSGMDTLEELREYCEG